MLYKNQKGSASTQGGQILLVVVLVIIITSTIGLSVASRTITNLRSSTEEADSQKALSAAEAGIEKVIKNNVVAVVSPTPTLLTNNSSFSTREDPLTKIPFMLNGGFLVPKDEGADIWFVGHDVNGNPNYSSAPPAINYLNLYWKLPSGSPTESCGDASTAPSAIEAIVVSRNSASDIKTYRYAYDRCGRGNNFTTADPGASLPGSYTVSGISGVTFTNKTPDNDLAKGISNIVFVRVIPLYKDAVVAVDCSGSGCASMPIQGYLSTVTGNAGSASHKISSFVGYQQTYLPYLSYGLFVAN